MNTFTWIIEVFLHIDRRPAPGILNEMTEEFVQYRIDFFKNYTLKSILNQTDQDFKIFLQTGQKWKHLMVAENWHPKITLCFDWGKEEYAKIDTDYLAITRIDSDDLFHKDAIMEVKETAPMVADKDKRKVLVFRQNISWDTINKFIAPHVRDFIKSGSELKPTNRTTSPFFTHIFPKEIYQNWEKFQSQHFCSHGHAGDRTGQDLSPNKVCIVKHDNNWSRVKRNITPTILNDVQKKEFENNPLIIFDTEKIKNILKDYGVIL